MRSVRGMLGLLFRTSFYNKGDNMYYQYTIMSKINLPEDSGYLMLTALAKKYPWMHGKKHLQIAPVRATTKNGRRRTDSNSVLHIRGLTEEQAHQLSDSWFILNGQIVLLSTPTVVEPVPQSTLLSRLVVFKDILTDTACTKCIQEMYPNATVNVGKRRVISVHGYPQVGHVVCIENLTDEESINLQNTGMGKHTSMGCGVFYYHNAYRRTTKA